LKVFDARLAEAQSRSEEQLALFRGRAEEMAQRLEKIASEARRDLAETRKLVERITREFVPQIRARLDESVARAADEFDAATACEARRRSLEQDVARAAEQSPISSAPPSRHFCIRVSWPPSAPWTNTPKARSTAWSRLPAKLQRISTSRRPPRNRAEAKVTAS